MHNSVSMNTYNGDTWARFTKKSQVPIKFAFNKRQGFYA